MNSGLISRIVPRRVWDSRGNPTVEVDVWLEGGAMGRAIAPAGASRGSREAIELRDGGDKLRGLDVGAALAGLRERVAPALIGRDITDQSGIDAALIELDGTADKSSLGGNAMVAASMAALHAAAALRQKPLWLHVAELYGYEPTIPLPEIQIFGGGAHAGRRVDVQDFMVMVPGAESFDEVLSITAEIHACAGRIMSSRGQLAGVADEGGWWPVFDSNEEALETLVSAIEAAGEKPGDRVVISLDIAASEFGSKGSYKLALENRSLSSDAMIDLLGSWIETYPIASVEDPLAEDDRDGMKTLTERFADTVQIIGDDYLVTDVALVEEAARDGSCNAVLIKVNQAGTVTEAVETLKAGKAAGFGTIVSARSGESEDVTISHLAVGLNAGQLKVGSFTRSERMAKWNECLRIQEHPGAGLFVGAEPLAGTRWGKTRIGDGK
ncbi:MAG: phosphopyruvate hydratase [Pseudomonadota bacterium]